MTNTKLSALEFAALGEIEATGQMLFLAPRKGGIARMTHILQAKGLIEFADYTAKTGQLYSVTKAGIEILGG